MIALDLRTVLISYTACNLICALVMFNLWKQNKNRFKGLDLCMLNYGFNFFGLLLISLRGIIPDIFSILIGNIFLISGIVLLYVGMARFLDRKVNQIHNYVLVGIYIALQSWFIYGFPSLHIRTILFSLFFIIFSIQIAWLLFTEVESSIKKVSNELMIISSIYLLLGVFRLFYELFYPSGTNLFITNALETYLYLSYQLIFLLMTFYFFFMVNNRLISQLELDIRKRQQTEIDLKTSQEKFYKAFYASPSSVLISRVVDGKFVEVNDQFQKLTGYTHDELVSSNLRSLDMWVDLKERDRMIHLLKTEGNVRDFEFKGRIKSGEIVTLSFSGEIITIGEDECVLSILQDITESKQIEAVQKLQITLWQYSATHTSAELMQKALDEIEELTGSTISFFHFMDSRTNSLKLQAWSTRTKDVFCKAEGEGMHYPLESAGVWCDAVRLKQPVIHNDYESLVEKKGMPEGHAPVIRELVVPIMRDDSVKAVLGVGNKPINYQQKDIDLVTNVANIAWFVIIEKQADEEIRQLNSRLEDLAMKDELTKIFNRRAFFIKGEEEILRAKRYNLPLSLIMLDIDRFKLINDTYGHDNGDFALQCLASTLMSGVREVDVVGRLGGEEFGVLLPNTKIEDAAVLAERLRLAITENSELKCKLKQSITASFGVASYQMQNKNLDELLKNADSAMYKAKNNGRNRVELFSNDDVK